ncbi:MAG: hypothetical protein CSB24_03225 [Deltaproteobacteria bacterium]|nr:MAG: hypothetical protein CSB24_03225 [Deltaproteobacteria bacterium]
MAECWSCGKSYPEGSSSCPHCRVPVTGDAVDAMATIAPGSGGDAQIVPGVMVSDRYEVQREIGRGGMGIVYLARDQVMDIEVALKVVPQELSMDPRAIADLKRETAIAIQLTHPNIMRLHTLATWEGQVYVVMEYVSGGTLAHVLAEKQRLSLAEALPLLKEIGAALDYSHNASPAVIHRDLKPLNILLTKQGRVKVTDYGLARVLRDSASRISGGDTAGTLSYMAPEQVRGKGIGRHTDIYALAAICYELLSGTPPFHTGDLRWQIINEDAEPIADQPDSVNRALLAGLAKDKENRPASAAEFVKMLTSNNLEPCKNRPALNQSRRSNRPRRSRRLSKRRTAKLNRKWLPVLIAGIMVLAGLGYDVYSNGSLRSLIMQASELTAANEPIEEMTYADEREADIIPAEQEDNQESTYGSLNLTSVPSGATVYLDGKMAGTTPYHASQILNGTRTIELNLEGYKSVKKEIEIIASAANEHEINLNSIYGSLNLTSVPSGATVYLDGKMAGTTPYHAPQILNGTRTIELNLEGYEPVKKEIEILASTINKHEINLGSIYGSLNLTSVPSGATVYLDGEKAGTTPYHAPQILNGTRTIELRLEGYEPVKKEIEIISSTLQEQKIKLASIYGSLKITSVPSGATIYVDGKEAGKTPYYSSQILKGTRTIELYHKGYEPVKGEIDILSSTLQKREINMVSIFGRLNVTSVPEGATVYVNGKNVGQTPYNEEVVAGEISVSVSHPLAKNEWQKKIMIVQGKTTMVTTTLVLPALKDPATGMEFVYVKGGCYQMGNTFGNGEHNEKPIHQVCVKGFYMGKYEVTQGEWMKIMDSNPSMFKNGNRYPVEQVSWDDTQAYIKKLNRKSGKNYRLPTEAEWEYAAREGGKNTRFGTGKNTIESKEANFDAREKYKKNYSRAGLYRGQTVAVGSFAPNALGLYDMSGNVWEWCQDRWHDSYMEAPRNGSAWESGSTSRRVLRGGSWYDAPEYVRASDRCGNPPDNADSYLGFRLVYAVEQ